MSSAHILGKGILQEKFPRAGIVESCPRECLSPQGMESQSAQLEEIRQETRVVFQYMLWLAQRMDETGILGISLEFQCMWDGLAKAPSTRAWGFYSVEEEGYRFSESQRN